MLKIYPIGSETFLFHIVVIFDHQFLQAQLPALKRQDSFDIEKSRPKVAMVQCPQYWVLKDYFEVKYNYKTFSQPLYAEYQWYY